jgi:hypothetical protein
MPDLMRDWHLWWLDFWTAHPVLFWIAAVAAIGLSVVAKRYTRRS